MKTKLIKIDNYWIVLGNEDIQKDDWIYDEFGLRQARWEVDKSFKQPKVLFSENQNSFGKVFIDKDSIINAYNINSIK